MKDEKDSSFILHPFAPQITQVLLLASPAFSEKPKEGQAP
jgi:hypothetical protein